jgi:hypothetical protein
VAAGDDERGSKSGTRIIRPTPTISGVAIVLTALASVVSVLVRSCVAMCRSTRRPRLDTGAGLRQYADKQDQDTKRHADEQPGQAVPVCPGQAGDPCRASAFGCGSGLGITGRWRMRHEKLTFQQVAINLLRSL